MNIKRETLTVYRMEFGIAIWPFISVYPLANPVCFGAQIRAVSRGTGKSQCLKTPSLVTDSLWSLAWHGVGGFLPIPT